MSAALILQTASRESVISRQTDNSAVSCQNNASRNRQTVPIQVQTSRRYRDAVIRPEIATLITCTLERSLIQPFPDFQSDHVVPTLDADVYEPINWPLRPISLTTGMTLLTIVDRVDIVVVVVDFVFHVSVVVLVCSSLRFSFCPTFPNFILSSTKTLV